MCSAEIEGEPAFENLRAALGMNGEIEIGKLGVVGRRLERTLQLEERGGVAAGGLLRRSRLRCLCLMLCRRLACPAASGAVAASGSASGAALATRTTMVPS